MQYDNEGTLEGYVMAGSRVDYSNELGEPVSDAYAISSTDRKVVDTVQVGPRGVHTYAVWTQDEFWSHSDGDGHFYVVRLSDLSKHTHKPRTTTYNVNDIDYSSEDLIPGSGCRGLHAIAYSAINQHLYTECSGGGGVLEFDVSNGAIAFVHQHIATITIATRGRRPSGSGSKSSIETEIQVPGHPSTVSFLSNGNAGAGDYIACSPLTENLNQKHRKDGELVCDYYVGCTGATTAEDVEHGICLHDDGGMLLKKVTEALTADDSPACSRCADSANFDDDGACVCTPSCGSCDPAPTYDDSSSGYMCVDLGAAIAGTVTEATLIPNTGGMKQGKPYGGSADCSFGRTYRTHKRGGIYDASVASAPENSIHIINMQTRSKQCEVALPGQPSKVTYAPLQPTKLDAQEGSSMKASSAKRAHLFFMSWMMVTVGSMVFTWATW
ncbi:expressed unknown protein [Seminavis robusta]|uniref:Uncharacterized protein n=1 Tax=Seminavis robusta TaxID=568900 RepID=A0A9N8EX76_9STRA|nr:expressed unknown protein [Seminavis robusta]|eukprot:Sro2223_g319680.1 n/a (440) ;mRNA; r:1031-2900